VVAALKHIHIYRKYYPMSEPEVSENPLKPKKGGYTMTPQRIANLKKGQEALAKRHQAMREAKMASKETIKKIREEIKSETKKKIKQIYRGEEDQQPVEEKPPEPVAPPPAPRKPRAPRVTMSPVVNLPTPSLLFL
jgi:hypothetical protein